MAQNFLPCDREQELLLPPSLRDWLAEDHLAWFVIDAVEALDLEAFYADYRADGWGRAAHDPAMMLALVMYAYAIGERSARAIERRCAEDVAFRVICANRVPDHATIARFRVRHEKALGDTFTQVLVLCAKAGLASVGLVALDGSPVAANASEAATRSYRAIREEVEAILEDAARVDSAEDARLGATRGDELPPELSERHSRRARLRRCRQELEAEQAAEQTRHEARCAWRVQWEAEHGRKLGGRQLTPPDPEGLARRRINTTDPDSRRMIRGRGKALQGYNVQVIANPDQVILATEVTQAHNDAGLLAPMVVHALEEIRAAGITEPIGTLVADGGYWSAQAIAEVGAEGIEVLVPTANRHRRAPRRALPRQGEQARRIEAILATEQGAALYRRRQQIVEPIFAQTKVLRRMDRFQRRGLRACRAEWRLIAATHNLLKLWRSGRTTALA